MFIVIEIDRNWTIGIDWGKKCKGIRLGFIAIHAVNCRFDKFVKVMGKELNKESEE